MSYCRWSSDNFYCDIYAYESDMGFEVMVANNRHMGPLAAFPSYEMAVEEWKAAYAIYNESLKTAPLINLDLEGAGENYVLDSLEEFEAKMLELRAAGFVFPDYVLASIAAERAEEDAEA